MRVHISMVHLCSSRANSLNSAVGASGLCSHPHLRHQVVRSRDLRHHHHHHKHQQIVRSPSSSLSIATTIVRSSPPSHAKLYKITTAINSNNNSNRNISTFGIKLTVRENQDISINKPPTSPLLKA